jgi:hypothetical protein
MAAGDDLDAKLCQPLGVEDKVDRRSACALARSPSNPRSCGRSSDRHEREERAYGPGDVSRCIGFANSQMGAGPASAIASSGTAPRHESTGQRGIGSA